MNKTAIKNFAIWARNKLIADVSYRAGLMGITENGIAAPLPQSTGDTEFYDIGAAEPYSISGDAIRQRRKLTEIIRQKEKDTDYKTAYKYILEEVAYTWFNRLIAVRFMEVNDYLPGHIRCLSSESGKLEPDLVTTPFDGDLSFTASEEQEILTLKQENQLDELFRILFIKQCNALNEILPALFEQTKDYTELLLSLSIVDQEGVVWHLIHDIPEDYFNIDKEGQVEIIGWMYQYYNAELNEQVYDGNMSKSRITKELLPAATTIYTPDWAIQYMVQNSLARLWLEGHPNDSLKENWKYYLEEAEQEARVQAQLEQIYIEYRNLNPEDIKVIDPCMGSGHILVYCFDVLMQIYESQGYTQRDAAQSILEKNLFGLDIDKRAAQLAYFAVMMKARQYDRRILTRGINPHVYAIKESNGINRRHLKYLGTDLSSVERDAAQIQINRLLDTLVDAKEYGSILNIEKYDWELLQRFAESCDDVGQMSLDIVGIDQTQAKMLLLIELARVMAQKYEIVVTNPPYLGSSRFSPKLDKYVKDNYADVKSDLSMVMYKHATDRMSVQNGYVAFITTSSWMFLSSFVKLREYLQRKVNIVSLVDFGTELFDGKVGHNPIVAWIHCNRKVDYKMTAIRLVDYCYSRRDEKELEFFEVKNRYIAQQSKFSSIPGSPVAYWVGNAMLKAFNNHTIGEISDPRMGLTTGNNDYYLRLWFEVSYSAIGFHYNRELAKASGLKWFPYNKGGDYRKWYGNQEYIVNWLNDGKEMQTKLHPDGNRIWAHNFNLDYNFKKHLTWNDLTSGNLSFRAFDEGFLFDSSAAVAFIPEKHFLFALAYLNTNFVNRLSKLLNPTMHFKLGDFCKLPYLEKEINVVEHLAIENKTISANDWNAYETSWDFKRNPLIDGKRLSTAYAAWKQECEKFFRQVKRNEEELNRIFIDIYGLKHELTPDVLDKDITVHRVFDSKYDVPESMKGSNYVRTMRDEVISFISYVVGCIFGRYSLDEEGLAYAGGEWDSSKYQSFIPDADGILPITDEEYLDDDIVARLCAWLKVVYGEDTLEENLDFIAKALGTKGESSREIIRNYFLKDFFKDHCKIYQKRPIYWLFDSGKQNGFKALIYLHRYTPDTIGNLRIDYLHKMQRVYESEMDRMQDMMDHSTNAREVSAASRRKDKLARQLKECRDYDEKVSHLALSRIELDLDDGVKVNYRKLQTAYDGKFYEVLADSKNIMVKEKK